MATETVDTPQARLTNVLLGFVQSRCLFAAVELELADALAGGPLHVDELARRTKTHAGSLARMVRALASIGLFEQVSPVVFGNSPASELLRKDVPGSQWAFLRYFAPGWGQYEAWGGLVETLRTGETAFDRIHGMDIWEYYRRHPDQWAVFNEGMRAYTSAITPAVTAAYDWSRFPLIVDVGGGIGAQLVDILEANPSCRGVLFDQSDVVKGAIAHPRMTPTAGDFFAAVPAGADCYLLRQVIHDWGDGESRRILQRVREACGAGARVTIVDSVIPETAEPDIGKWTDLHMMIVAGNGKERTQGEFRELLEACGFALEEIVATGSPLGIVVGRPR